MRKDVFAGQETVAKNCATVSKISFEPTQKKISMRMVPNAMAATCVVENGPGCCSIVLDLVPIQTVDDASISHNTMDNTPIPFRFFRPHSDPV
jgi:hypothetical protein